MKTFRAIITIVWGVSVVINATDHHWILFILSVPMFIRSSAKFCGDWPKEWP